MENYAIKGRAEWFNPSMPIATQGRRKSCLEKSHFNYTIKAGELKTSPLSDFQYMNWYAIVLAHSESIRRYGSCHPLGELSISSVLWKVELEEARMRARCEIVHM